MLRKELAKLQHLLRSYEAPTAPTRNWQPSADPAVSEAKQEYDKAFSSRRDAELGRGIGVVLRYDHHLQAAERLMKIEARTILQPTLPSPAR